MFAEDFDYFVAELEIGEHYSLGIEIVLKRYGSKETREALSRGFNFIIEDRTKRIENLEKFKTDVEKNEDDESRELAERYASKIRLCESERSQAERDMTIIESGIGVKYRGVYLPAIKDS